jgi:5'(3')-deoxyribonucleotidase
MADQEFKVVIFCDMDNVLNNFTKQFALVYNAYYGDVKLDYERETSPYDVKDCLTHLDPEIVEQRVNNILAMEHYWDAMELIPHAQEMLELLNSQYNIKILTAPHWPAWNCIPEKINWLRVNFPFINPDQLVFSQDKGIFCSNSILIDDYPKNITTWRGKTIKPLWGYNKNCKTDKEFMDWNEVPKLIMDVLQEWKL